MDPALLRIHHLEPSSLVNGPGQRFVIWVQGCSLGCPGCFNPYTHPITGGKLVSINQLADQISRLGEKIEGITISGGEPLQQLPALTRFLRIVKAGSDLSVVVFSGFSWAEIQRMPGSKSLLPLTDVLLAGRFIQEQRLAAGLLGSSNKSIHFLTPHYSQKDFESIPEAEIIIKNDGTIVATGIDPLSGESHDQPG